MRVEGFKSQGWLIDNLYQTPTLADKDVRPYAGSDISIEGVCIGDFQPTQRYVIDAGVRKQEGLRELVLPYGEDTLCMGTGGIDIIDEENGICQLNITFAGNVKNLQVEINKQN